MKYNDDPPWAWRYDAKCRGEDTEIFFPPRDKDLYKPIADQAKAICWGRDGRPPCPVRTQCLKEAILNDELHGIFGGLSHRERNAAQRKIKKQGITLDEWLEQGGKHGGKPTTIPSKDLKAFLNTNKRETRLMGALERHVLAKPFDERDQSYIHPSDIIKPEWCALAQFHAIKGNYVETREKPTLRLASIFAEGHTIHAKWQTWFAEMGVLYGKWFDAQSENFEWNVSSALALEGYTYKEVPLRSDKHMMRGHADGWIKGLGDDCLIEIKSIGTGTIRMEMPALMQQYDNDIDVVWKNIRTPLRSHQLQGQIYLHLCHLMVEEGLLDSAPKEIVFIYELKANQEYKEFVVKYNPEYTAEIFDKARDVSWAVENDRAPVCSIDPEKGCKRCAPFREEGNR